MSTKNLPQKEESSPPKSPITKETTHLFLLLSQGKQFQDRTFPVYQNFLIRLRNAYKAEDKEVFLSVLREYLQVANRRLPSAPTLAVGELLMMELRVLIEEVGFMPVARYLLSVETTAL